jgi:hypothetical protein
MYRVSETERRHDFLRVIILGGFSLAYQSLLPDFERLSGITAALWSSCRRPEGRGQRSIRIDLNMMT